MLIFVSADPLPPRNVYMTNQGYPNRLSASWRAEPQGHDGYRLLLYHSGSGVLAASTSVGKGISKFTFSGLDPGHKYLLEVMSVAGPYAASAGNISDWTSEQWGLQGCMKLRVLGWGEGGRDGVGNVAWKLQQRDRALGVMEEGRQYIALGYPSTPSALLPGTQKIPGMGNMGKLAFSFFFFVIFRNVEMADKHNKSFHVLIPTVPALCLGDPEVSAPTLSQPCRVLGVMCRALQAGR